MNSIGRIWMLRLFALLWTSSAALAVITLAGCAASAPGASAQSEAFTDSDEPETRKRATNRLRLAVLYLATASSMLLWMKLNRRLLLIPIGLSLTTCAA
jgi:uncharacterized BrkB/YihY/UPF0761 family membrane protein